MKISYNKGRTINLGNFESTRVDVGIEVDAGDGNDFIDADDMFEKCKRWVESKLAKETVKNG